MCACGSCRCHPVQAFRDEDKSKAHAIAVHGDEGQGKNNAPSSWCPGAASEFARRMSSTTSSLSQMLGCMAGI